MAAAADQPFVLAPDSIPDALGHPAAVQDRPAPNVPPIGGTDPAPSLARPVAPPSTAYRWADQDGFATGQELEEAYKDPAKLQALIAERLGALSESTGRDREAANFLRQLREETPEIWRLLTDTIANGGQVPEIYFPRRNGQGQPGSNGQGQQPPASQELQQLRQEVQQLRQGYQQLHGQSEGQRQVSEFAAKYPDAPQYFPMMKQIMAQHPGATLSLAYQHAKMLAANVARSGGAQQQQNSPPVSERPTVGQGPSSKDDLLKALGSEVRGMKGASMEDRVMRVVQGLNNLG